jgi:hypothetical protein
MSKKSKADEVEHLVEPAVEVETKPAEEWCKSKATPDWLFAATRALRSWPHGLVLDELTYDAAIDEAAHVPLSAPSIRVRSARRR